MSNFEVIDAGNGKIIKAWKKGVQFEEQAVTQLKQTAQLPFIHKYIAAMPDCHWGMGSTVGTVLPTKGAVVPAAVGVDIGCGMMALRTSLTRADLGDLKSVRAAIEKAVPHGRTNNGGEGDVGSWSETPDWIRRTWDYDFSPLYEEIVTAYPGARARRTHEHLGTLGTGNHFIELAEEEGKSQVWIVLHSGSRGLGNKIGSHFTRVAQELCDKFFITLPHRDLAYLPQGTDEFNDYMKAVNLAQRFAWSNRQIMMHRVKMALADIVGDSGVNELENVHCHHNYIAHERHFGENVLVTRKGAVRAELGDLGIIPGSMGARTYIVRGLGNRDSFCTCSHGAGRAMSRTQALKQFTEEDHAKATQGVECIKDRSVLDETPGAYKDINAVMAAQSDLVEPLYILKQFVCVKGGKD